jgi:hypothetical protein
VTLLTRESSYVFLDAAKLLMPMTFAAGDFRAKKRLFSARQHQYLRHVYFIGGKPRPRENAPRTWRFAQ